MMVTFVPVIMSVGLTMAIGATFWIKRRAQNCQFAAKADNKIFDDMVPADPKRLLHQLRRQMSVAQMPRDLDQMTHVLRLDLDEFFGGPDNFDDAPIFQLKTIAMVQMHCIGLVEEERGAA